mmetsp:Transcript_6599/g.19282  ORF Transcript_6599/g.19282 Transcript_6599/m.19282 type:complete len:203 (-) Transcript_6599:130-738(-)
MRAETNGFLSPSPWESMNYTYPSGSTPCSSSLMKRSIFSLSCFEAVRGSHSSTVCICRTSRPVEPRRTAQKRGDGGESCSMSQRGPSAETGSSSRQSLSIGGQTSRPRSTLRPTPATHPRMPRGKSTCGSSSSAPVTLASLAEKRTRPLLPPSPRQGWRQQGSLRGGSRLWGARQVRSIWKPSRPPFGLCTGLEPLRVRCFS